MANRRSASLTTVRAICFTVFAVIRFGRTDGDGAYSAHQSPNTRPPNVMQYKWLINTGNFAGRWPPLRAPRPGGRNNGTTATPCTSVSPNTITRMQMIHGGATAVLVMPTGDGGNRCFSTGFYPQFSLGYIDLKHGQNNLFPIVQPFPDWRAFVQDAGSHDQPSKSAAEEDVTTEPPPKRNITPEEPPHINHHRSSHHGLPRQRIVNAVDAFLDNKGRILWVLDTGLAGEDACYGNTQSSGPTSKKMDDQSPPRVFAIDVQTNQIINIISLSRVWLPGVSCFQYVVAVYLKAYDMKHNTPPGGGMHTPPTRAPNSGSAGWPLVVVGDAGRNRLLVYSYTVDMFTEIMMPLEEYKNTMDDYDSYDIDGSSEPKVDADGHPTTTEHAHGHKHHHRWVNSPRIRDILYIVPLSPHPGQSRLLVTYHGCRDLYKLRLQPSSSADISFQATVTGPGATAGAQTAAPRLSAPVTGTLTVMGWKPCRMVVIGTDRRKVDTHGDSYASGGTTVFFRLENTNDIWSWNTAFTRKKSGGRADLFIDERDFRLVRLGRTCRVPVAVSAAPVTTDHEYRKEDSLATTAKPCGSVPKAATGSSVQQIVWMLETNFVDHFAGTADNMGVNAKLQPLESPLYGEDEHDTGNAPNGHAPWRPPSLRVQKASECRRKVKPAVRHLSPPSTRNLDRWYTTVKNSIDRPGT